MELNAHTPNLGTLLSQKSVYRVPRFQRDYSWKVEEVAELWSDLENCIVLEEGELKCSEYFIGTLVLVGKEGSSTYDIVDGQQRLTTITIMLRAIQEAFVSLGEFGMANALYSNYIEGVDDEGKPFFKVRNVNHSPFFEVAIQHKVRGDDSMSPQNEAERNLLSAYKEALSKTNRSLVSALMGSKQAYTKELHLQCLKSIRDQLTKYLKVIFIRVPKEEEAYTIFETLNARGLGLASVDLIKNTVFKDLSETHPEDKARREWTAVQAKLQDANANVSLKEFMRHWWISRYTYVSEDNLYKEFKKAKKSGLLTSQILLSEITSDVETYVNIIDPQFEKHKQVEDKRIFRSLMALRAFNVTQPRAFLLSLFNSYKRKLITKKYLVETLEFLESFNFQFVAICQKRSSGIEGAYSSSARKLFSVKNKPAAKRIILDFIEQLKQKSPSESEFEIKFKGLKFSNDYTKDKKIIQYVFNKIELYENGRGELAPEDLTLEHIMSQSSGSDAKYVSIGNLLPLSKELNEQAGDKTFVDKVAIYRSSSYKITQKFCEDYKDVSEWDKDNIIAREEELSALCFNKYWKIA
ncbi:DUF262 domain-containing protein [Cobetia marina]|uniref:DUF262 domain-containing protein n=1 Tax=Cobetia marina TaxID=28258 RepID=UPI00114307F9|nr:DUF262 domain-containing protein [Cobetia marina]GED40783.1 hypothetical protein HHA02_01120 [Cobetia marina]